MAAADKQQQLIDLVKKALDAPLREQAAQLARIQVDLGTILARIEIIDGLLAQGGEAPKRAVKAAGGAKKGGAKAAGAPKITNSLLYYRNRMATDEEYRGQRLPEDEAWKEDPALAKKDEAKDPDAYWRAAAGVIWKTLDAAVKAEVKAEFEEYKAEAERANGEPQLDAENGE